MAAQWYYRAGKDKVGPLSVADLKDLAASGELVPNDLVWRDGMEKWVKASGIKGLFPDQADDDALAVDRPRARGSSQPFRFDGGAGTFVGTAVLGTLLTMFTFGIGQPWAICMMQRWKAHHTLHEGRRLQFNGTGLSLIGIWLKWLILTLITVGIYLFWVVPDYYRWVTENTSYEA